MITNKYQIFIKDNDYNQHATLIDNIIVKYSFISSKENGIITLSVSKINENNIMTDILQDFNDLGVNITYVKSEIIQP